MKKQQDSKEGLTFYSFEELGEAYGLKPKNKRTKDKQKLESQRKRMSGTCKICGSQLHYVQGTNVFYCPNKNCKGYERTRVNAEGNEVKIKQQVFRTVDNRGARIASVLFDEE